MMDKEMMSFYKNSLLGSLTGEPLCVEYRNQWRACGDDKEKYVKLALRQQSLPYLFTYSYNGKGLSKKYLKETFEDYINGKYVAYGVEGVSGYSYALYVDEEEDVDVKTDVSAFLYCNDTLVVVPNAKCPILYVGCGSTIRLALDGFNSPRVYLFDDSKLILEDGDTNSDVTILKYSDESSVEVGRFCLSDVKEFRKELRL